MKKLTVALIACLTFVSGAFAQEDAEPAPEKQVKPVVREEIRTIAPVCFSLQGSDTIDIIGLRLGAWGSCHDITGLDLSIWGESVNAYGLQLALLRNNVIDRAAGLQLTLGANHATQLKGAQVGLWNDTVVGGGLQIGLVNSANDMNGIQIGLVNTTDLIYGYQIGLINVIKGATVPVLPIINTMLNKDY